MAENPYTFVKATGRDKYWKQQQKELLDLMDPETGELKESLARHVDCCVCKSKKHNLAFMKEGFRFVKCCDCGMLFVSPQVDTDKLIESYEGNESQDTWVDILLTKEQQDYDAKHRFGEALQRLSVKYSEGNRKRLLDVGCSVGLFMKLARDLGWNTHGMEISKKAYEYATKELGLTVDAKLLHEVDYPKKDFQVISMWGVLEHTPNPDEILEQVHPLLADDGTLVMLIPNGHSFVTRVMHEYSPTFGGRNHLWYFSPDTITQLLEKKGFKVTDMYTQLSQFEETLHFLRYNNPYLADKSVNKEEFNISPELREQVEKFIFENNLGYKLIVFAERA